METPPANRVGRRAAAGVGQVAQRAGPVLAPPLERLLLYSPALELACAGVIDEAYAAHPERFVRGRPRPPELPTAVWINPPARKEVPPQ
jgi:hypothetical protein